MATRRHVTFPTVLSAAAFYLDKPRRTSSARERFVLADMKTMHSLLAGLRPANSLLARGIAFPLLFLGAGLTLVQPCAGAPFQFEQTGSMRDARYNHPATLLSNGKVLVAGGEKDIGALSGAELYDQATGTWSATGSLATARFHHTATLLPNGKVLVVGG